MNSQNNIPETEQPTAITLGHLLSQARHQKGLSVGEVAERLKLPARQIDAMENGCYKDLPEDVFIKGFLTTYARFLELDMDEIHQYLQQIFPDQKPYRVNSSEKNQVKASDLNYQNTRIRKTIPSWVFGIVILAIGGGIIYAWQGKSSAESAKQVATASQEVSAQASSASVIAASNVRVVPMTESEFPTSNNQTNNAASSELDRTNAETVSAQQGRLTIKVETPSWIQINDKNGVVLLNRLVENGFSQNFEGGAPYQIIIGYTPGVSIQFDGKDVPIIQNNKKTAVLTVGGN